MNEIDAAMGQPGRNAEQMIAPADKATSPKLKERLQRILADKPGLTVMVWTEKAGNDLWIVTVDFKDGTPTGGGGRWRALPEELPIESQ